MYECFGVHLGGCGTNIGLPFWDNIREEHQLDGQNPIGQLSFFREKLNGQYVNRGFFLDSDPIVKQKVKQNKGNFLSNSVISGNGSCLNLYSEGIYGNGSETRGQALEQIRKQVEYCDRKRHFLYTYSAGGGAGSGMIGTLIGCYRQIFNDDLHQSFQVLPSFDDNTSPLEVYNSVLQLPLTVQEPDCVIMFENEAVYKRLLKKQILWPSMNLLNKEIAECIRQITCPDRFHGCLNSNFRKLVMNLAPFYRLKFFAPGFSLTQQNFIHSAVNQENSFIKRISSYEKNILTMAVNVRGDPFSSENGINHEVRKCLKQFQNQFVYWIPHNLHISMTSEPNKSKKPSASSLINSQENMRWLAKAKVIFDKLFRRKAFLHNYTSVGMDEMEFTDAQSYIDEIISQYFPWGLEPIEDEDEEEA